MAPMTHTHTPLGLAAHLCTIKARGCRFECVDSLALFDIVQTCLPLTHEGYWCVYFVTPRAVSYEESNVP